MIIPKPAAPKTVLLLLAGVIWFSVGTRLLMLACSWLNDPQEGFDFTFLGIGIAAAIVIHFLGFRKIVIKNIKRIMPAKGKLCVFSFFTWKSYLIIIVMIAMGILFRSSSLPKPYLAILYTAIGVALMLSSLIYIKVFACEVTVRPLDPSFLPDNNNSKTGHSEQK